MEVFTKNAEETKKLGGEFANKLTGGEILALSGDLGSGKTTFVQGLAKGLGIKERVISPTFVLVREYDTKIKNQKLKIKNTYKNLKVKSLYHIDLYRLEGNVEEELRGLGIEEIWGESGNVVAIEWAEKVERMLPGNTIWIKFEHGEGHERRIII